jgi:hypothetical protein
MYSAASDFHGQDENVTLENHFTPDQCTRLLRFLDSRR